MQTAESEKSDQSKRPLVSWRPAIHPTNLAGGLFPDFQVLLFGIRADDGEHWVFSNHLFYYFTDCEQKIALSFPTQGWFLRGVGLRNSEVIEVTSNPPENPKGQGTL